MSSQKILVLGGTGATGVVTVERALEAGYEVTVFARSPGKIPDKLKSNPKLKIVEGSFTDSSAMKSAFSGQDIVLSLLGPNNPLGLRGNTFPPIYKSILSTMRSTSVKRIYALSTFSVPDSHDQSSILKTMMVWFIWFLAHSGWMEFTGIGDVFEKEGSGVDWTLFRVGWLLNGDSGHEAIAGYVGEDGTSLHVKRNEIARWLVGEVGRGAKDWISAKPGISSNQKVKSD